MASALADPILLFFLAGLLASGFLLANGRGKKGLEGTSRMLDGSLAFATTGHLGLLGLGSFTMTWFEIR